MLRKTDTNHLALMKRLNSNESVYCTRKADQNEGVVEKLLVKRIANSNVIKIKLDRHFNTKIMKGAVQLSKTAMEASQCRSRKAGRDKFSNPFHHCSIKCAVYLYRLPVISSSPVPNLMTTTDRLDYKSLVAWVEVDNKPTPIYSSVVDRKRKNISCFIASEESKV